VIEREGYIKNIRAFIDKPVIKLISGMRRSGKSVILMLLREELARHGGAERVLYLNFESQDLSGLENSQALYGYIKEFIREKGQAEGSGRFYILLDEVQRIPSWERTAASLRVDFDCDIYITGSNASLLSGELYTLLAGRFVVIPVYPLSFAEHLLFTRLMGEDGGKDQARQFLDYLRFGGLPGIHEMNINSQAVFPYLRDIFNSVMLHDVIARYRIRDIELLERIVKFLMDNRGNIFSAKSISDFLKSQGRKLGVETVYNYLKALEEAFLIRRVGRYDIRGKRQLETREKIFFEDHGIQHAIQGFRNEDIPGLLENVVFMELKRRGFEVYTGQLDGKEVDFIALRREERLYIQVCYLLADKTVADREFGPLLAIRDHHPKMVLSMDQFWDSNQEGIVRKHIADFLLEGSPS
jgi:predicted AAA+ superfamily ATPase